MKKAILISGHFYKSKRKAGFHQIAEAFVNSDYSVVFVTAPCSFLFKLKKHYSKSLNFKKNKLINEGRNISSFVHFTPFHISNLKLSLFNYFTKYLYKVYQAFPIKNLRKEIEEANVIIFESTPGLFLFSKFKKINNKAKYIYRVSDDLEILNAHPSLIDYEMNNLSKFDLVSVPSQYIYNKLKLKKANANIKLHYHGIKKELFDRIDKNPYDNNMINAVFIGITKLDYEFLLYASDNHKEIIFHIIGPLEQHVKNNNIIYYGELPFIETISYVKHADMGLHTLEYSTGAESFTDSLKVHQYTYCSLPILAPEFLRTTRENTFYYKNKSEISSAIEKCINYGKNDTLKQNTINWEELKIKLLED